MLSPSPNTSNKRAKGRNTHDLPHLHPPQTAWCNTNLILTLSLFSFACFNLLTTSPCSLINNSNFSLFDMFPNSVTHPQTYNVGFFFFRFVHCTCPSNNVCLLTHAAAVALLLTSRLRQRWCFCGNEMMNIVLQLHERGAKVVG